jgi:predicted PurR-regulated permease PerM
MSTEQPSDHGPGETPGGTAGPSPGSDLLATLREADLDWARLGLWAVALLILVGLWLFFWRFTGTLVIGLFVYYVARPVFKRIHPRVGGRTTAVVVTILAVALPVLILIAWALAVLIGVAANQFSTGNQQVTDALAPLLEAWTQAGGIDSVLTQLLTDPLGFLRTDLGGLLTDLLGATVASLAAAGVAGLQAFIILVITFYLLRDDYRIAAWGRRTFAPEDGVVERYLVSVDRDLENVFFGNILNAIVTGLIAVVTYLALNTVAPEIVRIPQPALVGMLVGAASLVPAVGIKLVTWPIGAYLLAVAALSEPETVWFPAVFLLVSFVVVDYIPDQLLRPYVSGRTLHVGAVMLAYLFGPLLFGWIGIFLGPLMLVLVFEFGRIVVPWLFGEGSVPESPEPPAGSAGGDDGDVESAPPEPSPAEDTGTAGPGDDTTAGATPSGDNP